MSVSDELVQAGFALLAARALTDLEAAHLASLYGSKEELIAHLLLREPACAGNKAISGSIRAAAELNRAAARTRRVGFEDISGHEERRLKMTAAQKHFVDAMQTASGAADGLVSANAAYAVRSSSGVGADDQTAAFVETPARRTIG